MRSEVTPLATGGAWRGVLVRLTASTACPASTYSVAIKCSFAVGVPGGRLRPGLGRGVQLGLGRRLALDDDRSGQAATLVISGTRAVPVIAGAVEVKRGRPLRVVHQPDELRVAVARQHGAVRVPVVVDERELDFAPVGQDEDPRVVHQFVLED